MKKDGKFDLQMLKNYTNPQALKDLDKFLDALPLNVGYNALIAAGLAWVIAGSAVLFTGLEVEKVSKLRTELLRVEALQPPVPIIQYTPVSQVRLKEFNETVMKTYKGVNLLTSSDGSVIVSAGDTDFFPQFIAAISTIQRGGKNWRVKIDSFCAGRDCKSAKLTATLKVDIARVSEPVAPPSNTNEETPSTTPETTK